jgi:hypothetical protein
MLAQASGDFPFPFGQVAVAARLSACFELSRWSKAVKEAARQTSAPRARRVSRRRCAKTSSGAKSKPNEPTSNELTSEPKEPRDA